MQAAPQRQEKVRDHINRRRSRQEGAQGMEPLVGKAETPRPKGVCQGACCATRDSRRFHEKLPALVCSTTEGVRGTFPTRAQVDSLMMVDCCKGGGQAALVIQLKLQHYPPPFAHI